MMAVCVPKAACFSFHSWNMASFAGKRQGNAAGGCLHVCDKHDIRLGSDVSPEAQLRIAFCCTVMLFCLLFILG